MKSGGFRARVAVALLLDMDLLLLFAYEPPKNKR